MVEQVLLVLRIVFVILLYLFIWRVVRLSIRDVRPSQESLIISPGAAAAAGLTPVPRADPPRPDAPSSGQLTVLDSPAFPAGTVVVLDEDVVFGRGEGVDAALDGDTFASSRHARVFRRGGDLYVEDLGSTNGTFVNGQRLAAERRLRAGDVLVVGATEMRFEDVPSLVGRR
jgi:pSer/pThr/pTyr-binding forkhead associated (FHA) protein